MFRWGMLIGTVVLACVLCKFCVAKRRRCRQMRQQMRNQQMQMPSPHIMHPQAYQTYHQGVHMAQPVNQYAYPSNQQYVNQHIQMGRPPKAERQMNQRAPAQEVRGRPHESCMMREPQVQNQYVDAQIRFHENELMRLKNMARKEEAPQVMRREVPSAENFESYQPLNRKAIPVGKPLYEKADSSFASEYPEI